MRHPQLPVVDWCHLYSRLAEAVDNAGLQIVDRGGYVDLSPTPVGGWKLKVEPDGVWACKEGVSVYVGNVEDGIETVSAT